MSGERKPMVKLAELWQRKSASGNVYFSGFMGAAQILLFKEGEKPHPIRPDETVIVWKLLAQERDQAPRQKSPTRNAQKGQRAWDRARQEPQDGFVEAWSQPQESTPFYDDSDLAVADLQERGR